MSRVRVGFWYDRPEDYHGGINYFHNLLCALSNSGQDKIDSYLFLGRHVRKETVDRFRGLATVVQTSLLDRRSVPWVIQRILFKHFRSLRLIGRLMRQHRVGIVSHGEFVYGARRPFAVISWIPDFQYLHLPELFPHLDGEAETHRLRQIAKNTDLMLLSSRCALADYEGIVGAEMSSRAVVIPFAAQLSLRAAGGSYSTPECVSEKFNLPRRFFFLPNQFWRHKNHLVVFEAVRRARSRGVDMVVVCTGNQRDYRSGTAAYAEELIQFIRDNALKERIFVLGAVDYGDVLGLMDCSVAVINPSLFEGWSSTVEEARALGKRLIISDIPVHREQSPARTTYFDPADAVALTETLIDHWKTDDEESKSKAARRDAQLELDKRTRQFASAYIEAVLTLGSVRRGAG